MEYIWYIIAATGAGIGTGLAGLSAATVMVPILIVLCPSFSGETGAYQATAIALASDILGSAVTTATYIKHKNIDLRRGWIMLVCIISMCTVGSYAAFLAGNVVLGGFTLILTFCIGIRFLVKPDTTRENTVSKGEKLDWKGIAVSLFFGITIGFGTGFVGTGGGMMMLVVFTVFLGMELKPAVGTSTFIMTFTALIASVSHILIHPAIILEKWHVMLLCIAVATASSLISASFANRVSNRTVGLVTGVVLTILGASMIYLNYRDSVFAYPLVQDTLITFRKYIIYIVSLASALILIHILLQKQKNVFRKLLHVASFTSSIFIVFNGKGLLPGTITLVLFALIVYPALKIAENWQGYAALFVEKKPGEIRSSLLLLFLSQAAITAFSGIVGKPYILVVSTAAWGLGDIAAAWVGRPLGRHKINLPFADHKKSWEGSIAMAVTAFAAGLPGLLALSPYPLPKALLIALIIAVVSSLTEMSSKGGLDTVTVPVVNALTLWIIGMIIN